MVLDPNLNKAFAPTRKGSVAQQNAEANFDIAQVAMIVENDESIHHAFSDDSRQYLTTPQLRRLADRVLTAAGNFD